MDGYSLGIDLGTTSVKVVVVDIPTKSLIFSESQRTEADIKSDVGELGFEQDVKKINSSLENCIRKISTCVKDNIKFICFTGQMHGLVLWNSFPKDTEQESFFKHSRTSNLYTWQDQRATGEFLPTLPKPNSDIPLATGFGCVTYLWLMKNRPELLQFDWMGTVMDYFVYGVCEFNKPATTVQLAASFGYFNSSSFTWNEEILKGVGFPVNKLPKIVQPGTAVGNLGRPWLGINKDAVVLAGLGDVQCSFYSTLAPNTAVLNIGTSLQLGCVGQTTSSKPQMASIQYFPYFDNERLALAASLNGGNVISQYVRMLKDWTSQLGPDITEDCIWTKLIEDSETCDTDSKLRVKPLFFGERHAPDQFGSISGLNTENMNITKIFEAICLGVVENAKTMMPASFLQEHGVDTLICSGSVYFRNPVIRKHIKNVFKDFTILESTGCDSATGAAHCAIKYGLI